MSRIIPSIFERLPNRINMLLRPTDPGVFSFNVRAANTLVDAYGATNGVGGAGTAMLFNVMKDRAFVSKELRRSRIVEQDARNYRGSTQAVFDLDEYGPAVDAVLPTDDRTAFFRIEELFGTASTVLPEGPIIIVPPYSFMSTSAPILTLGGVCPNLATAALGDIPPPGSMNFHLPLHSQSYTIRNLDAALPIFVSSGPGIPFTQILPLDEISVSVGFIAEVFIASVGGNPEFAAEFTIANVY